MNLQKDRLEVFTEHPDFEEKLRQIVDREVLAIMEEEIPTHPGGFLEVGLPGITSRLLGKAKRLEAQVVRGEDYGANTPFHESQELFRYACYFLTYYELLQVPIPLQEGLDCEFRLACSGDIDQILSLRDQFGHSMLYQMHEHTLVSCLDEITVATPLHNTEALMGFYHLIPLDTENNVERIRCYKQIPEGILSGGYHRAFLDRKSPDIGVIMQGACHRELFQEFIKFYMGRYTELWCYISDLSKRVEGYKELGFSFHPDRRFSFFNVNKGARSTYNLGIWKRKEV